MKVFMDLNDDYSESIHYDRPGCPVYIRRGLLSTYPNYAAPSHWHDDIELIAILEGEMDYNVPGPLFACYSVWFCLTVDGAVPPGGRSKKASPFIGACR